MPPIFMAFVTERHPIFALHAHVCLRGMLLPQTQSGAGIFCILETESCNLVNTFSCKSNKGDEIKFQFYRLNRPNCALWMNFIGGQGWYTGHYPLGQTRKGIYPTTTLYNTQAIIPLVKHGRGYILQPPSINLHTWLSKQMPSEPEAVRAEAL